MHTTNEVACLALLTIALGACGDDGGSTSQTEGSTGEPTGSTSSTTTTTTTTTASTTSATSTSTSTSTSDTDGTGSTGSSSCLELTISEFVGEDIGVPVVTTDTISIGAALDPDEFRIEFYDDATGAVDLSTAPNDDYATCTKCVRIFEDDNGMTLARQYFQSAGTLTIAKETPPSSLAPEIIFEGVRLVEVTVDADNGFASTPVEGGQCIDIVDGTVTADPPLSNETTCDDGMDDDNDDTTDCGDSDCAADMACTSACMGPMTAMAGANAGDTTGGENLFHSTCSLPGGLEDFWEYTASADGLVVLRLSSDTDQGIAVRTSCADAATELSCVDDVLGGTDERVAFPATNATTYTIIVDGFEMGEEGPYSFDLSTPTLDAESEANDDSGNADALQNDGFTGTLPMDDEDWFSVDIGNGESIVATTYGQAGACDGDTVLEFYAPNGTTLLETDDDGGPGACSSLSDASLAAGTYFVRVTALAADVDYNLALEVQ